MAASAVCSAYLFFSSSSVALEFSLSFISRFSRSCCSLVFCCWLDVVPWGPDLLFCFRPLDFLLLQMILGQNTRLMLVRPKDGLRMDRRNIARPIRRCEVSLCEADLMGWQLGSSTSQIGWVMSWCSSTALWQYNSPHYNIGALSLCDMPGSHCGSLVGSHISDSSWHFGRALSVKLGFLWCRRIELNASLLHAVSVHCRCMLAHS